MRLRQLYYNPPEKTNNGFCFFYFTPVFNLNLAGRPGCFVFGFSFPYNINLQTVKIRLPGTAAEYEFELAADFPVIKRFLVH